MSIDEIGAVALELPESDRDELIARLQAARSVDPDVDHAWRAEVRRRIERIRAGDTEGSTSKKCLRTSRANQS